MYLSVAVVVALGILIILVSWWIGERKKVIDQFESDVRIFLAFFLVVSSFSLFVSMSVLYLNIFTYNHDLRYFGAFLYFLSPLLLGGLLYIVLPWFYRRTLHLNECSVPEPVKVMGDLLGLPELPQVCTSSLEIPPLVYGRSKKNSILVLPESMDSVLTEEEQRAVIAHELSHINQGDVGFFSWLTLLMEAFKYWILPFPVIIYLIMVHPFFFLESSTLIFLIPLFFVSMILLKNSLSRTRESLADAYVVFHGFEPLLKRALIKYAALHSDQKSARALWFYHDRYKSVLRTHPPLQKRLKAIDEKTYLLEETAHLSLELAFWIGLASAFLFYNIMYTAINLSVVVDRVIPVSSGALSDSVYVTSFFVIMGVVGASYIFPSTKDSVLFSDFGSSAFLLPLFRNWTITIVTAACVSYGLTLDKELVQAAILPVLAGFILWVMGFASSRPTDFSKGTWYLIFAPVFTGVVLWYPVQVVYFFFSQTEIDLFRFAASVLGVVVLALLIYLALVETGHANVDREERLILFFGKKMEFPLWNDVLFILLAIVISFSLPTAVSLAVYSVSCFCDTITMIPDMSLFFGVILILLIYTLKKSDILFFLRLSYLADILQGSVHEEDTPFIQKVIEKYQSPDGGFDYAGLHSSNQRDTFHVIKTAQTIGIQVEPEKIVEWITSTEKKGGFALFPGGYPRIEGVYYAVKSRAMLGFLDDVSKTCAQWIHTAFNGTYFAFAYDSHSLLLQTCYAVESLFLLGALRPDVNLCRWIETHFSETLSPKEAFFAARALNILNANGERADKWLTRNEVVATTRLDKNLEAVYYYVKVLREQSRNVPPFIVEQAARELETTREKYKKKF